MEMIISLICDDMKGGDLMSDKENLCIYKKVLETLPMPVLLVGADEHILFMNKS